MADIKGQILNSYLTQQMMTAEEDQKQIQNMDLPDSHNLEEFKGQVKMWIECDNQIKKLQALIKERNAMKSKLTVKILDFMCKYNIEDLNTKDGKLRFKQSTHKRNATLAEVKKRLAENFGVATSIDELTAKVFEPKTIQHTSLRRLKASK